MQLKVNVNACYETNFIVVSKNITDHLLYLSPMSFYRRKQEYEILETEIASHLVNFQTLKKQNNFFV